MLIQNRKARSNDPNILLLYGPPKIGKTTMLSQLKDCLIVDTERGSQMIGGDIAEIDSYESLKELIGEIRSNPEVKFKYIAIDTIDNVIMWIERFIVEDHNNENSSKIKTFADLSYGVGYTLRQDGVMRVLETFSRITERLILIGHRKIATQADNGLVDPASLDITGKLRNQIFSKCDAIGLVYRDEDQNLMVSFKPNDTVEAGSRCDHLKGKVVPFEWPEIYTELKITNKKEMKNAA